MILEAPFFNISRKVLGLIPARYGSKGVPRKNIRLLAGKPLIAWTIEQAISSNCLDRVVVSTDHPEIAEIASDFGAEVPFTRPTELSNDDTPDLPVYHHALSWLHEHENYSPDLLAWLRPTSPLRKPDDISAAVSQLLQTHADCVRSVCRSEAHPFYAQRLDGDRLQPFVKDMGERHYLRRQLLPEAYHANGCVDVVRCDSVKDPDLLFAGDVRAYIMPRARSLDIDTELDFEIAEFLMTRKCRDEAVL